VLNVGDPVTWTYVVTNTGSRDLTKIQVTDDQGVAVTCPGTTLAAGESFTCTASGVAQAGQYENLGTVTAEMPNGQTVSASDPSHYFGQTQLAVTLEKSTEGFDADTPPGPSLPVGSTVSWTYLVTNVGSVTLENITVTDDQGVTVTCPDTTLAPGASMTCTASGTVQPGQYANIGSVTADIPDITTVAASDPSHYFGQTLVLQKATNGQDADLPPGPSLEVGDPITWTYVVTNPGPATVSNLAVTDDQGVVVTCPQTTLAAAESVTCTATGVAQAGQYANVGTATAQLPAGGTVSASDPSHYFGLTLRLEKATNGQDADSPPGPVLSVGAPVAWTYVVTNLDSNPVFNVSVTDDQGVVVTCPGTTLAGGNSMTCTASGTAAAGQYANVGTVTADSEVFGQVSASDPSHYFGQDQILDFGDAPDPSYPTTFAANGARHVLGSDVYLGACVDSELDGQPTAGADGDDNGAGLSTFGTCAVPGDDEDGVTFTTPLEPGTTAGVDVVANAPCTLSAWIDFNRDGDWFDAGENLFPGGTALAAGTNSLTFAVPGNAVPGLTAARFRCTTDGAVSFAGEASDGEVEDYIVTLSPPVLAATKTASLLVDQNGNGVANPGDTLAYTVMLTNNGGVAATGVVFTDTPDANTALVSGSVTTTSGTVTTGNGPADTTVAVDVGTLAAGGGSVTIGFQVTIDDPLPSGVTQVANQGTVSSDNVSSIPTDDPGQPGMADPTVVAVSEAPAVVGIPAVSAWGLWAFLLLLAGLGLRRIAGRDARATR
jgi:uncharacterized repeat protein (TIGR01451 family)